jgi:hypothetical protein
MTQESFYSLLNVPDAVAVPVVLLALAVLLVAYLFNDGIEFAGIRIPGFRSDRGRRVARVAAPVAFILLLLGFTECTTPGPGHIFACWPPFLQPELPDRTPGGVPDYGLVRMYYSTNCCGEGFKLRTAMSRLPEHGLGGTRSFIIERGSARAHRADAFGDLNPVPENWPSPSPMCHVADRPIIGLQFQTR